jgi:uncharacterized SAM-binding protein YcdF (DUF218 family)
MQQNEIIELAQKIWDFHQMRHKLKRADLIFVLGSHDTRVAQRAADLFLEGWAPIVLFSGGLGNLTAGRWQEPEADTFAKIAMDRGVPRDNILIENKSTNTGENVVFSRYVLALNNFNAERIIAVQKPYMERRAYATIKKKWPKVEVFVTSPKIDFEDYPTKTITMDDVIHIMVGDLERIKLYPQMGFQIHQEIPQDVWEAAEKLIERGYTKHLVR